MKALIPAAGLGTRFLPATKAQPKEMLLVVDRPAIQYVVEEGLASAADEVVIINSHSKKIIEDHFSPDPELVALLRERGKNAYADEVERVGNMNVSYVYQEEALGLGHAVRCAAEKTGGEAFYVLLGDVLVPNNAMLPRMQEISDAHGGASVIAVMPVPQEQVKRFGVIAGEVVYEKCQTIIDTGANVICGADVPCLMNIKGALGRMRADGRLDRDIRVMHIAQILDSRG